MAIRLQAVILDLDGVLVDTSAYHARAWAQLVRDLGHEPPPDLLDLVRGISRRESLKRALGPHAARYSEAELEALAARKNALYVEAIRDLGPGNLYAGARALLEDLREARLATVIGSASKNARPVLERLGIAGLLDAVADGHVYRRGKPHPDVFLCGAAMVGCSPAEAVVVEDAPAGIEAALLGGFVAVGIGDPGLLSRAHLCVRTLTELSAGRLVALHRDYRVPSTGAVGMGTLSP